MINATIVTNLGTLEVELDNEKAPLTVENFVKYATTKHFDGLIFHRVIPNFMVQGGGMMADMKERKGHSPIQNEAKNGLKNLRGTLAMARTSDPHSASSQFFINLVDNHFLNQNGAQWGYAVFGKVVKGMDVVDEMAKVKTQSHGHHDDVPATPIVIEKVTVNAV